MTIPDTQKYTPVAVPVQGGNDLEVDGAVSALEERFIATPVDANTSPDATPYLEVVAPATLPEVCVGVEQYGSWLFCDMINCAHIHYFPYEYCIIRDIPLRQR